MAKTGPMMKTGPKGRALVEKYEGRRLESYRCPAGKWTIGVGHTGPDVLPNMAITDAYCDALLSADLEEAERCIAGCVKVRLSQNQFDALASLCFNIGCPAFARSTLVRCLNAQRFGRAADEFPRWCHSGGQVLPGLIRRRNAERDLFLSADG